MAKLTIGNQTVTIDDAFLSLPPEQQQKTVDEISASLGNQAQQPTPGNVAQTSPSFDAALAVGSQASQSLAPQPQAPGSPDLMGSISATMGGLVNGIPVLGPAVQKTSDAMLAGGGMLADQFTGNQGPDLGGRMQALEQRRAQLAEANPIANIAGNIGGGLAAVGAGGMTAAGSEALGLSGGLGQQMLNGLLSTTGITATDNMVRGQKPTDALMNAVGPGLVGGAIPGAGALVRKGAEGVANAATNAAQRSLTNAAIKGAPAASELKSAASRMFDASTGGTPLAISDNAFFRFLGGVKQYADKLRINPENDPQATGLLSTLMRIADDTSQGVAVDLKDLHLVRQLARKVSGSSLGRDASLGGEVVRQLDDLISTLKPEDVLGGADPSQATSALLNGISTWSRASKVGLIEEAVNKAGTYKSGLENGLRLQFQSILRNPDTRKLFTAAERREIERVANGTGLSNMVTLLGKFGFGTNGAGNMLGGTIGSLGAASLLGPLGGIAAAVGATGARKLSEKLGSDAAERVAQVVATPNIPQAAQRAVPQSVIEAMNAAQMGARGAILGNNGPPLSGHPVIYVRGGAGS